jgi:hypothetical protein
LVIFMEPNIPLHYFYCTHAGNYTILLKHDVLFL